MTPKVELHLHLDCAASFAAVAALRPGITMAEYRCDFVAPAKCTDLADLLTRPPRIVALMQTRQGLRLICEDVFDQLHRADVIYAELRFAPFQHLDAGLAVEEVVAEVERACADASAATGVETRLILCTLRHFDADQSLRTAELVREFEGTLVAALDIAGDEAGFPLDAHVDAFRYAEEHGLARTAHAGEAAGAGSVWETLERLRPDRIGHGVRSVEDPRLVERLRDERIHLEVCPSSNVQTDVCDTYADHPIDELYWRGVPLSVSTDVPTISDVTLDREYERLRASFGWGDDELRRCNLAAIDAAFAPDDVKTRLRERVLTSP
jgi:adenosine deaminase